MRINTPRSTGLAALLALFAISLGCGGGPEQLPVHPAKGVVRYKGEPMKGGGTVIFYPMGSGKEASGTINEDGTFTLQTYEANDGAAEGQYRVVVYQVTMQEPESSPETESTGEATEIVPKADQIPKIYSDATQSPVTKEITAGENDLTIELEQNVSRGA